MITTTPYTAYFVNSALNASLWLINVLHGSDDVIDAALRYLVINNDNSVKDEEMTL